MARKPKIRVVVVEDSELMAREISRSLQAHNRLSVVGVAHDGNEGLRMVRELRPDVVTLDVNMPDMDGLTCLQYIMIQQPTPCVIVSSLTDESAIETFEAYELGAISVVEKPSRAAGNSLALFKRRLAANVVKASYADVGNLTRADRPGVPHLPAAAAAPRGPGSVPRRVIVIGASTGGPRTLMDVVPRLPADLGAALLIVQHMPGSFTGSYARRLDEISALPVSEAVEGEVLLANHAYLAPGDFHLRLERSGVGHRSVIRLQPGEEEDLIVPSVDIALDSAIDIFGTACVGVVLTGLGSDGALAMERLFRMGGTTIAESEVSAVIYGMPKAVVERGVATEVLPSRRIAEHLVSLFSEQQGDRGE